MRGSAEKTVMLLAIAWFTVAAGIAGVLWLLTVPYQLWRPVVEKAFDWCNERA
jgi:hypothetical protein